MGRASLVTPCTMCRKKSPMIDVPYCENKMCFKKFMLGTEKDQKRIQETHIKIRRNYELRFWCAEKARYAHEQLSRRFNDRLMKYVDSEHREDEIVYRAELASEGIEMECEEVAAP